MEKEKQGGHLVPETLPVLFREGKMTTQINYDGLIPCYPKITLDGPATNPVFINLTTNKQFMLGSQERPFVLGVGSKLVVDMEQRQVLVNGKSASYHINELSEWWCLNPGLNKIYYRTSTDTDTDNATLEWRSLVQGC